MAYIREKTEELTGYQEGAPFRKSIDLQCDFVMVYGTDQTMPQRIQEYREQGYVIHLMTGIAWGEYQDYLNGEWDGREHWDEAQTDRRGNRISHNPTVPYMVPTISFTNYLIDRLKIAVDAGVEALHLEEPEFWNYGGYSAAFQREYGIFYKEPWQPPHTSLDIRYKTSRLMAYLYGRAVNRISSELKEYSMTRYGKNIPFYVPTHSLVNYTQWKIMSPEAALIDIPTVDGCIAQIWTGTSRTGNVYEGCYRERTFETAYLEYGVMQELVRGTGRRMWFLHDPIEDRPKYHWESYRENYLKTVTASFLHPEISRYEICPWPHRVFDGVYPRIQPKIAVKDESSVPAPDGKPIPQSYATLLSSIIQLCGDMDQDEYSYDGFYDGIGLFMSDSGLFQRSFPDGIAAQGFANLLKDSAIEDAGSTFQPDDERVSRMMEEIQSDKAKLYDYIQSGAFPQFFAMSLPLLKYGLPIQLVQLDNISRFADYLNHYKVLILSYEYIKPASPDINASIASWARQGGHLIYIGDGSDPFHNIDSFWKKSGYDTPAQHLFSLCGLPRDTHTGAHPVGDGSLNILPVTPAIISANKQESAEYRNYIQKVLAQYGILWTYQNDLTIRRGPYVISSVMQESCSDESKILTGLFADLLENDYKIIHQKEIHPNGNGILFDFSKIEGCDTRIIGTSARIYEMDVTGDALHLKVKAADRIKVFMRLRLPKELKSVSAADEHNQPVPMAMQWDAESQTVLLSYQSENQTLSVNGIF